MAFQAHDLAINFSVEVKIDPYSPAVKKLRSRIFSEMTCRCEKKDDPCVKGCSGGRYVSVYRHCWAGNILDNGTSTGLNQSKFHVYNATIFDGVVFDTFPKKILDKLEVGNVFAAEACDKSECFADNENTTWLLNEDSPCSDWCNCEGIYCTRCKSGYSRLPSAAVSLPPSSFRWLSTPCKVNFFCQLVFLDDVFPYCHSLQNWAVFLPYISIADCC